MRKLLFLLISVSLFACTSEPKPKASEELKATIQPEEIIEMDLKTLLDEFDFRKDREFEMNKKYVGKKMRITGRTSGVTEDGELLLQLAPGEDAVKCYGIADNFLISIKKDDIVTITGILDRVDDPLVGKDCVLRNCSEWKKIMPDKRFDE